MGDFIYKKLEFTRLGNLQCMVCLKNLYILFFFIFNFGPKIKILFLNKKLSISGNIQGFFEYKWLSFLGNSAPFCFLYQTLSFWGHFPVFFIYRIFVYFFMYRKSFLRGANTFLEFQVYKLGSMCIIRK